MVGKQATSSTHGIQIQLHLQVPGGTDPLIASGIAGRVFSKEVVSLFLSGPAETVFPISEGDPANSGSSVAVAVLGGEKIVSFVAVVRGGEKIFSSSFEMGEKMSDLTSKSSWLLLDDELDCGDVDCCARFSFSSSLSFRSFRLSGMSNFTKTLLYSLLLRAFHL